MRSSGQSLMTFVCFLVAPCCCFGQYGNSFHGQNYHQPVIQNGYSHSTRTHSAYSQPSYSQPTYSQPSYAGTYARPSVTSRYAGGRVSGYGNRGYSNSRSGYTNRTVQRSRSTNLQNLRTAQPGRYYRWKTASGTSEKGYVAHDGSRWKLLKSAGIVEVDRYGNQHTISHQSSGHPHRYVWQIQKNSIAKKTAWISRSESTGSISVFYQRPRYSAQARFYPATVVLEDGNRIVNLTWQRTPDWAAEVRLVVDSKYPTLPVGIHRSTAKKYLPASEYDVAVAQRAMNATKTRQLTPQLQPYEEAPEPATVVRPSLSPPAIALPYQNYRTPAPTVAR